MPHNIHVEREFTTGLEHVSGRWYMNSESTAMNPGDVVVFDKTDTTGKSVKWTTSAGDSEVVGVVNNYAAADSKVLVWSAGTVATVKVNGTSDITASSTYLKSYTSAGIAQAAGSNAEAGVFGLALESYTTNDSAGEIKVHLLPMVPVSGVSLSGSTNNTVATVTGANALIGETNLTFASNILTVGASADIEPTIKILNDENTLEIGVANGSNDIITGSADGDAVISSLGDHKLLFGQNDTLAVTLDADGDVTFANNIDGGTWLGTAIGSQYGGTGQNFSSSTGVAYVNSGTFSAVSLATKGHLLVGDGSGAPSALAVGGTGGHVLQVDSSEATGMKWAASPALIITALNNATANELVTVGTTVTELDAEAQLTFDGDVLAITGTGTAKANKDILTITNDVNAADMDGTETSILFNQWYYDGSSPAVADAGRISIGTEQDWTSTGSTQDSYMAFETAIDGTVAERVRITSAGNITSAAAATWSTGAGALTLNGTGGLVLQEGGAAIISISDARAVTTANTASIALDASGVVELNSSGGALSIGNDNIDQAVNIATAGTRTLNIGIQDGTDITTINMLSSMTIDSTPADNTVSGITATFTAGEALERGEVVYFKQADSKMWKAVATAAATSRCVAMAAADISADAAGLFLLQGFCTDNGTFPDYSASSGVGKPVYTPEAETSSQNVPEKVAPDTDGDFVQIIGYVVAANTLYFNPSNDIIEHA